MVAALAKELVLRKREFADDPSYSERAKQTVDTIYFGGGTPSVLSTNEINFLIDSVNENYTVSQNPEITLEANPDDLTFEKINELAASRVNRLSIGIQSFFDEDLRMMNRAHSSEEAKTSLAEAVKHFSNISIDLIYGIPGMTDERWEENIQTALSFGIPHISAYALTVEPRTALKKLIADGKVSAPKDDVAESHFRILAKTLAGGGFVHYELSNFGKPGYFSRNNSAYWLGKKYLGIGPSAHSFDGKSRSWNIANNSLYLKGIEAGELPSESEILTATDCYNEYVMTGLRTIWGVSLEKIRSEFGQDFMDYILKESAKPISDELLSIENGVLKATAKGKFLADGIASSLFVVS